MRQFVRGGAAIGTALLAVAGTILPAGCSASTEVVADAMPTGQRANKGLAMTDRCTSVRVTYEGGFAGTVSRVDLERAQLDEAQALEMDAACDELATLAGHSGSAEPEIGADIPKYRIEIDGPGGRRSFAVSDTTGRRGAVAGSTVGAVVDRLGRITPH